MDADDNNLDSGCDEVIVARLGVMVRIWTLTADASFEEKRDDTFAAMGRHSIHRQADNRTLKPNSDKGGWHETPHAW